MGRREGIKNYTGEVGGIRLIAINSGYYLLRTAVSH